MKKLLVPVVAVALLMSMSFAEKENKFEIIKTENGQYLTNVDMLSLEDLIELQSITHIGAKTTDKISKAFWRNFILETITKNTDPAESKDDDIRQEKLNKILAKY